MVDDIFEGTLILEKLAALNLLDQFYNAIDSDDFVAVKKILKTAQIDNETINIVITKMFDESDP